MKYTSNNRIQFVRVKIFKSSNYFSDWYNIEWEGAQNTLRWCFWRQSDSNRLRPASLFIPEYLPTKICNSVRGPGGGGGGGGQTLQINDPHNSDPQTDDVILSIKPYLDLGEIFE